MSNVGKWHHSSESPFGLNADASYEKAMAWLVGHGTIEDWGCGTARAKAFAGESRYVGVDGSPGYADRIADLGRYRSDVPCILMRGVLEHNEDWQPVLLNALMSFSKRMTLVVFTPFAEETKVIARSEESDFWEGGIPDLSFREEDLLRWFGHVLIEREDLKTEDGYGNERFYFLERRIT